MMKSCYFPLSSYRSLSLSPSPLLLILLFACSSSSLLGERQAVGMAGMMGVMGVGMPMMGGTCFQLAFLHTQRLNEFKNVQV